ncbi:ABC transporter G family member 33-like [Pistacia vera]|uniref:ABC transporter G family member 33-like n=1 Tax=Pistacia vera TaxID=55513 RepID=UPI001262B78B|nr:ABC transporter G family member 33-like [Pistacia vera]
MVVVVFFIVVAKEKQQPISEQAAAAAVFVVINDRRGATTLGDRPFCNTKWAMRTINGSKSQANKIKILKDVSGIIRPSRLTLLLGPPGCGKTTLLQALSGKLDPSLKQSDEIQDMPGKRRSTREKKPPAWIKRCCSLIMKEISRREKEAGIIPKPDIDTFMKAISVEGLKKTLQTEYILKILGLEVCADTIVGNAMKRGISGGQKKRLTTGEMIIGPSRALFLDEILNGLGRSTTFQIVACLKHLAYITASTVLISLLQPAPETFDLFDDIILMAEGKIVYHGPRSNVLEFFEHCGLRCPPRKGVADFLQEVVFEKDQAQYWCHKHVPHSYVSLEKFKNIFNEFHVGQKLNDELSRPLDKHKCYKNILSLNNYWLRKWELFKACLAREWLLMKRNSFIYLFKTGQLVFIALITVTVFLRTQMKIDFSHADYYMTSLFYALMLLYGQLLPIMPLVTVLNQRAPGRSRAIISHDKLCCLKGTDNLSNTTKGNEFPSVITIEGAVKTSTTALMGVIGAGKTALMDVLSGKKTGGIIEGEIRVCGYPKVQDTHARISGYCERTDIHSPQITIEESEFVAEVLQLIELDEIKDSLVGIPGTSGISNEQRKRLTIAVELVSNPSIIFMDEPTSGLDARAAAVVVMRVVKNIVHTKRTVVCTIHQPSIDIFKAFDELILMKRGGEIIYSGELCLHSSKLSEYFEVSLKARAIFEFPSDSLSLFNQFAMLAISLFRHFWVPKIKHNYNPATWMLEVTSPAAEAQLGLDFALLYKESHLFRKNMELVRKLIQPAQGSKELHFSTRFPQNEWEQFKACLWKHHLTYWRSPNYTLARLALVTISSFLLGAVLWQKGQKM